MDEIIDITDDSKNGMANVVNISPGLTDRKQEKKINVREKSLANLRPGANGINGRKPVPVEFKNLVTQNTVPALMTVINIMQDSNAKNADRLKAAEMLLERAYGKAIQPIVGDINTNSLVIKLEGQLADWAK